MYNLERESVEEIIRDLPDKPTLSEEWRDHVIICGLENLGFRIIEQLKGAGVKMVVLDDHPDAGLERRIRRMGITLIKEDSRNPENLVEAGIFRAAAVISCENQDLHNLETIMVASELVPGIRTVASFFNQKIGEQITKAIPNAMVLSLSEKAGPSFAEACVPSSIIHIFSAHADEVAVVEAKVTEEGSILKLFGRVTPLAVRNEEYNPKIRIKSGDTYSLARNTPYLQPILMICPSPDFVVYPGQYVILAGRIDDLSKVQGVKIENDDVAEALAGLEGTISTTFIKNYKKRPNRLNQLRKFIGNIIRDIEKPFRYALLFLVVVILLSTVTLWFTYRSSFVDSKGEPIPFTLLDALYFTITIVATVGFGDYSFVQQDWLLKVFGIGLILVGALTMSVVYAFVTNFVISRRIEQAVGIQKAREMENHIVLCGMGTIGYQVMLALLKRGKEVAVIEKNESGRFVSEARNLGVPVIFGDAKLPQVLKQANIQKAKAIAIVTSDDLANLETALIANSEFHENVLNINKRLKVVLRVFDKSLGDGIARNFDIRNIYSASGLAAPYYVAAALNFEVVSTFYLDRQPFIVAKLVVKKDSVLDGITVNELYQKVKVSVLALVERDKEIPLQSQIEIKAEHLQVRQLEPTFHPTANRCLLAGDTIYFVGLYDRVISTYMLNKNEKDPIPGQK